MRYRKLDPDGDYTFGHGQADLWFNQVDGVGQAIRTRLLLFFSEWFLDTLEGTRWGGFPISDQAVIQGRILGTHTAQTRDMELQQRIINTQGMFEIIDFSSNFDGNSRVYAANAVVSTIYGKAAIALGIGSTGGVTLTVTPVG